MFTKFNTDEVVGMRSLLEISAMPTFKVFKAKAEVGCQRGWNESRAVLTQYEVAAACGGARYSLRRTARACRGAGQLAQRPNARSRCHAPRTPEALRAVRTASAVSTTGPKSGR